MKKLNTAEKCSGAGIGMMAASGLIGYSSAQHWSIIVYIVGGVLGIYGYWLMGRGK
jgi:hypothetical protein